MLDTIIDGIISVMIPCVLPICIVWILNRRKFKSEQLRAEVLIKAIESNNNIDADKLADAFKKPVKSEIQIRNLRLLRGCIFSLTGLFFFMLSFIFWLMGSPTNDEPVVFPILVGSASLAIGISYLIVWKVMGKQSDCQSEKKD